MRNIESVWRRQSSVKMGIEVIKMPTTILGGTELMTDKQWDGMLLMIETIIEKCKDKDEALEAIRNLLRYKKDD
jgi:hypothetical protein